jgi:predicted nucleic acid-binding Zn ribbon protein
MSGRRRPMRRLGELLPGAAAELGLEEPLRVGRAMAAWQRLVEEHLPAAAGATRLLELRDGVVIVAASAPIVAQELHLRAEELLTAFGQAAGGQRMRELRVVVRPPGRTDERSPGPPGSPDHRV